MTVRSGRGPSRVAVIAATLCVMLALPFASLAQTPYDVAEPPVAEPVVPTEPAPGPGPQPEPEAVPDVTELPLEPVTLPEVGAFGGAGALVGGEVVVVVIRDPSAPLSADDPVLLLVPGLAVIEGGGAVLLPIGPAGSSREVAVTDLRIVEVGGVVSLIAVRDGTGEIRSQLASGALQVLDDDGFLLVIGGLLPGSTVRLTLFSEPSVLGLATVAADGTATFDVPVPAGTTPGPHQLQYDAVRADGALITVGQLVEVVAADAVEDPAVPEQPGDAAPAPQPAPVDPTPDDDGSPVGRILIAVLVALAVVALVLRARRRSAADSE